jgi:uncharacterized protein
VRIAGQRPSTDFITPTVSARMVTTATHVWRTGWTGLVLLLSCSAAAAGQQLAIPRPIGFVSDFANVIAPEYQERIRGLAEEVRAKSGGEIAVVTLPSLEGRSRDEVALRILREWGVGGAGPAGDPRRHSGTVILVVPRETSGDGRGHSKIELGYGTNTFITAAQAGRIQDERMIPRFREGDYGGGILAGVEAVAQRYADHFGFELTGVVPQTQPVRQQPPGPGVLVGIAFIVLILILASRSGGGRGPRGRRRRGLPLPILMPFPMGGRHRGGFGGFGGGFGGFGGSGRGGIGGGGFGGFGGGLGGGGGAGRSW